MRDDIKPTGGGVRVVWGDEEVVMSCREREAERKESARTAVPYSSLLRLRICLEIGEMSRSVENPSELEEVEMLEAAEYRIWPSIAGSW